MPRRSLLTPAERASLLAFPVTDDELIRHYSLTEADRAVIRQHRGAQNRLGFAVHLCCLRHPGFALPTDQAPLPALLSWVARQLRLDPELWPQYALGAETRREHLRELHARLNLTPFGRDHFRHFVAQFTDLVQQTDRGIVLATALVESLRRQRIIIIPAVEGSNVP